MTVAEWPNCVVPDCPHKCYHGSSAKCYAHYLGLPLKPEDPNVLGYFDSTLEL